MTSSEKNIDESSIKENEMDQMNIQLSSENFITDALSTVSSFFTTSNS